MGNSGNIRFVNTFISKRYQIEVTEIGRRLPAKAVSRSGLGMAVSSECKSSGSTPVSNKSYIAAVRRSRTPGSVQNCLSISLLMPYTPTAVADRRPEMAVRSS